MHMYITWCKMKPRQQGYCVLACLMTVFLHHFSVNQCGLFGSLRPNQNLHGYNASKSYCISHLEQKRPGHTTISSLFPTCFHHRS